jgi:hypothetical protein
MMNMTLEEMLRHIEETDQTLIEIDGFDLQAPCTEINVVVSHDDVTMLVRVGWGALGLHADVTGYLCGDPVETEQLNVLGTTSVYVTTD